MAKPKILISLLTEDDTKTATFRRSFLGLLFERALIAPEFAANYDPVNNAVNSEEDAARYWTGGTFFWLRRHSIISRGGVHHTYPHKAGTINLDASFVPSFDWPSLFRELVAVANAHYGYLHLVTDGEWGRTVLSAEDASIFRSGAFAKTLETGFIDLAWGNYFGRRFKSRINPIKLANVCSHVEPLEGGYFFNITDEISVVKADYVGFDRQRQIAKEAFEDGFFRSSGRR